MKFKTQIAAITLALAAGTLLVWADPGDLINTLCGRATGARFE